MGLIVKNNALNAKNNNLNIGDIVRVIDSYDEGIIVFVAASLYQVQLTSGNNSGLIMSYYQNELERV